KHGGSKRNAELNRRDGDAAFAMRMRGVEPIQRVAPRHKIAGILQLIPNLRDAAGVLDQLSIVRAVTFAIEITFTYKLRRKSKSARNAIEYVFDHQHALRTAKSAKSSLRGFMRAANKSC